MVATDERDAVRVPHLATVGSNTGVGVRGSAASHLESNGREGLLMSRMPSSDTGLVCPATHLECQQQQQRLHAVEAAVTTNLSTGEWARWDWQP